MDEAFGRERVLDVLANLGGGLRRTGHGWLTEHGDDLAELGKIEAEAILSALKRGDTAGAKFQLALHMKPEEWRAYRDGTVEQLRGIAIQRAQLLEALEDLGRRSAEAIGKAAGAALGL